MRGDAAPIPITTCGVTIPAGAVGVLQNDVTCRHRCVADPSVECRYGDEEGVCDGLRGCEPEVLLLRHGARLEMNGHTVQVAYQNVGASCTGSPSGGGRCTVVGPGTFYGEKGTAVAGWDATDLVLENVTIGRCDSAIFTRGRLWANGLVTLNDRENTVYARRGIWLRNARIMGDYGVVTDGNLHVRNVEISAPGGLIAGGSVRGRDLRVSRYADIEARSISLRRVIALAEPAFPSNAPVLSAERGLRLIDSSVLGIESGKKPILVRSTCETSSVFGGTWSWHACTAD